MLSGRTYDGRHGDAQQVCAAMFELWGAIDALGTFEGAHAAAKRASVHVLRASPAAEAASEPARPFAPDATRDSADCMPEWLAQAALLLTADADAAAALGAAGDTTMAAAGTARAPVPVLDGVGGRHARRRRYCGHTPAGRCASHNRPSGRAARSATSAGYSGMHRIRGTLSCWCGNSLPSD